MIRVLIAEDEAPIGRELKTLIHSLDSSFEVTRHALNGKEAIHFLKNEPIDVLFTDINMPVVDGFALLSHVKEYYPNIRCVILTGFSEFSYAKKAVSFGVVEYLLKPIDVNELASLLGKLRQQVNASNDYYHQQDSSTKEAIPMKKYVSSKVERKKLLLKIEKYLRDNYDQPISTKQLGETFGLVPSYLSKLYRNHYGLSPKDFVTQLRIQRAKTLIRESDEFFVRDVAALVGYDDPLHFSKLFRKATGYSPSEYRHSLEVTPKD